MFMFSRAVTYTKPSVIWQYVGPLRFFSSSSTKAKSPWSKIAEIRRKQYDESNASYRAKYAQDQAYREKRVKRLQEYRQTEGDHEKYVLRRRDAFLKWVIRGLNRDVRRTWPTHTPEISSVRKTRRCAECDFYRHKRLWWKRNGTDDSFDVRIDRC